MSSTISGSKNRFRTVNFWLVGILFFVSQVFYGQESATTSPLPPGDGRDVVGVVCTQCHGLGTIRIQRDGPDGWKATVHRMVMLGAQLFPEEAETVVQYLSSNFGPESHRAERPETDILPAATGKDLVETQCTLCHNLEIVLTIRRTREEWDRIVSNMITRGGLEITSEQSQTIVSYLTAQYGKERR